VIPLGVRVLDALHEGIDEKPTLQRAVDVLDHLRPRPLKPVTRARAPQAVRPHEERLFSVVVPCYNYGRFLEEAVRSVLDQVGVGVEVIVVDDASTDSTPEVARRLAEEDSRVRYRRNDANLGHVLTFNVGLAETVGDFVVRLDADDLIAAGAFARAAALLEAFPSVGLVYGHPRHFTTATRPLPEVVQLAGPCGVVRHG
jgi:cellulose synthase/poly-beta-1,6-N-acetylglucosamine synthase-like glycosyltransferase